MKHLNLTKNLLAFSILGVMAACSSENAVTGRATVSDVTTSDCKTSVSKDDTRPEYYADFYSKKTKLRMLMGDDNVTNAQFIDVMDNCAIGKLNVDITCSDNKMVIILYPDRDMLTDCVCLYDVNFKIRNLLPGSYQIEIYQTTSNKQINPSRRVYKCAANLEPGKAITITMNR